MNRTVFALATVMMLLFFVLSNYDHFFFSLHFLESLVYIVVLLLLFYGVEDWAYVIGVVAPLFWIVLTLLSGASVPGLRALWRLVSLQGVQNPVNFLSGLILLAALGLIVVSARSFHRDIWGRRGALRTAVLATVVVGIYYGVVVVTLFHLARPTS